MYKEVEQKAELAYRGREALQDFLGRMSPGFHKTIYLTGEVHLAFEVRGTESEKLRPQELKEWYAKLETRWAYFEKVEELTAQLNQQIDACRANGLRVTLSPIQHSNGQWYVGLSIVQPIQAPQRAKFVAAVKEADDYTADRQRLNLDPTPAAIAAFEAKWSERAIISKPVVTAVELEEILEQIDRRYYQ